MNKKVIKNAVKVALTAGALAAALTGCCMFKSDRCCCTNPDACCCADACCREKCHGKTRGMNTSMTVGVGTDGVRMGGDANVGSHGVSADVSGDMH